MLNLAEYTRQIEEDVSNLNIVDLIVSRFDPLEVGNIHFYRIDNETTALMIQKVVQQLQIVLNGNNWQLGQLIGILNSGQHLAEPMGDLLATEPSYCEYHYLPYERGGVPITANSVGFTPAHSNGWGIQTVTPSSELVQPDLEANQAIIFVDDSTTAAINTNQAIVDARAVNQISPIIHVSYSKGLQNPPKELLGLAASISAIRSDTYRFLDRDVALAHSILPGCVIYPWRQLQSDDDLRQLAAKMENGRRLHTQSPRYLV